jgi:DNA-binding response OmpR family regulator
MKKRILLVDGDAAVQSQVTRLLGLAGYEVVIATDWLSANNQYYRADRRPDVLLIEVELGTTIKGTQIAWAYARASMRPGGGERPVILLFSAHDDAALERMVADSGADGYIRKRPTMPGLVEAVNEWSARETAALAI